MTYAIGRGVRVEVGVEGTSKTVTEVTEADPPVATSAAHGLAARSVGYFSVATGMPQLEGQAVRFSAVDSNTLTIEDLDTTSYGNFTAGTLIPIASWLVLSSATNYNKSGGEGNPQDITVLLDTTEQQLQGQLSAETVALTLRTETIASAALQAVRDAARNQGYLVFRITLPDGNVRIWRGQPSLPTESLDTNGIGQTTFSTTVKGLWLEGAA